MGKGNEERLRPSGTALLWLSLDSEVNLSSASLLDGGKFFSFYATVHSKPLQEFGTWQTLDQYLLNI